MVQIPKSAFDTYREVMADFGITTLGSFGIPRLTSLLTVRQKKARYGRPGGRGGLASGPVRGP
ncbi:MAG: hypothetical protein ACK4TL_02640 [Hyphomicrobiaceae bacterium]